MTDREALEYLRELQVTYEVAANRNWVCRGCGGQDVFANTIKHFSGCKVREILGGDRAIKRGDAQVAPRQSS